MAPGKAKAFQRLFFWLSFLLHIILFLLIWRLNWHQGKDTEKPPMLFIPATVYTGAILPMSSAQRKVAKQSVLQETAVKKRPLATHPKGTIALREKKDSGNNNLAPKQSLLAASFHFLNKEQRDAMKAETTEDPIYLVGDQNEVADPLIKLLGKALSAHFHYPKMAGSFGIQGRVLVRMILHPDGHLSDVQMLQSSHSEELDAAALYAVNTAPLVKGADRYLTTPKRFLIGFIFRAY